MQKMVQYGLLVALILAIPPSVNSLEKGPCPDNMVNCQNGRCILTQWVCDTEKDCSDGSDEENCDQAPTTCLPTQFTCRNNHCISLRWTCDGEDDCPSGEDEDEALCSKNCPETLFECEKGKCIPLNWVCDGDADCANGKDEQNCTSKCDEGRSEFRCKNKECVDKSLVCDGKNDCGDGSDEIGCMPLTCRSDQFKCGDGTCILSKWRCDGDYDCRDKSDEENCGSTSKPRLFCRSDEFPCPDQTTCIPSSWVCNGKSECVDGADEIPSKCPNVTCLAGEFRCKNNTCVPGYMKCNEKAECADGSDEEDCFSVEPHCGKNEFHCGKLKCIAESKVCDTQVDCPNGEDEPNGKCFVNECKTNNGGCSHLCVDRPVGFQCECPAGYKLIDNSTCVDIDECADPDSCSQLCINEKGSYKCECMEGYIKEPSDHKLCKVNSGDTVLIFTARYDIRQLNVNKNDLRLLVNSTKSSIALDFHYDSKTIFWSDGMERKILKTKMFSDGDPIPVIDSDLTLCDGLAVDWIYEHIYWSDTEQDSIMVATLDGRMRKKIISIGLDKPRALALNPMEGWMFWSDWGKDPRIERAGLDGTHRSTIASYDVQWPNGLALDFVKRRLYWIDAKLDMIFSCDYDGGSRKIILKNTENLAHPFSIAVFEDYVFWTDWINRAIFKASKFDGSGITAVAKEGSVISPMVVHIFHPYKQPNATNYCKSASCSHLCLPAPQINPLSSKVTCACPDGSYASDSTEDCFKVTTLGSQAVDTRGPTTATTSLPSTTTIAPETVAGHIITTSTTEGTTQAQTVRAEITTQQTKRTTLKLDPTTKEVVLTTTVPTSTTTANATEISNSHLKRTGGSENSSITYISIGAVLVILTLVGAAIFLTYRNFFPRYFQPTAFDNPLYRSADDRITFTRIDNTQSSESLM